ncbi:hypothetical protein SOVF_164990 [Spinacia oleracea]|nr:hypothetical protein SOVF_164990 [Spinacia oleracea]
MFKLIPSGDAIFMKFSPGDPSKFMVTIADSQVRILGLM